MAYQYSTINHHDSIRLLSLSPGKGDNPLHGALEEIPLSNVESYEALSYVWGSEEKRFELKTDQGTLNLTESLFTALRSLRLPPSEQSQKRRLWADAICINQEDNEEKGAQVRMMGQIYKSATRVLVYLGDESETEQSDIAFDLLEEMASPMWNDSNSEDAANFRAAFASKDLAPVAAIMNRPWWQRVWVIQEFVNAKDVYMIVGTRQLHWRTFYKATDNTFSYGEMSLSKYTKRYPQAVRSMIAFSTMDIARDGFSNSFLELLDLFQGSHATRKRDHLFSLLSLANDVSEDDFRPDYEERFESVVRRYAAAFVQRGLIFHLLGTACPLLTEPETRFPSWIPDWTVKRYSRDPDGVSAFNDASYNAAGPTKPVAHFDREMDVLVITGWLIGSIQVVEHGPLLKAQSFDSPDKNESNIITYTRRCYDAVKSLKKVDTMTEGFHDALWRTLTLDRSHHGDKFNEEEILELKTAYRDLVDSPDTEKRSGGKSNEVSSNILEKDNAFCYEIETLTDQLSFAMTHEGLMSLVPRTSQVGDVITVLRGCPVPFVLRPVPSEHGNKTFRFLRKAYLHGFMNGEVLQDGRYTERDFCII